MRGILKIGDTEAKPGQIAKGSLGSVELANGMKAKVPLINVNGIQEGPILTVVSAVHGVEVSPIGALLGAIKKIDPASMRGALLGIPGANPLALLAGEQKTPLKFGEDLGALPFLTPVNLETATITQRMAHYLNAALEKADYVMDMHANPLPSIPFVLRSLGDCKNETIRSETKRISEAFGVTVIDVLPKPEGGGIKDCSVRNGKPSFMSELAGDFFLWESITSVGTRGILNVMKAIGMIDGTIEKQDTLVVPGDLVFLGGRLTAHRGGLMVVKKEPGQKIAKGEKVVDILDMYGDVVEEVFMPITGYCWAFTGNLRGTYLVSEGDKIAYIFAERSEHDRETDQRFLKPI
jgi:uncharacterized protein